MDELRLSEYNVEIWSSNDAPVRVALSSSDAWTELAYLVHRHEMSSQTEIVRKIEFANARVSEIDATGQWL